LNSSLASYSSLIFLQEIRFKVHPIFVFVVIGSILTGSFIEILTLFGIVLIHELGHVFVARSYGWTVTEIQLLPFGGMAVVEEWGTVPAREEIIVALAGPFNNLIMILVAFAFQMGGLWSSDWVEFFIYSNMVIALFNLLPILPLDGGKVMEALLSYRLTYYNTIHKATWISFGCSFLLLIMAVSGLGSTGIQINLLMIGAFLIYSNWYANKALHYQFLRFLMKRNITPNEGRIYPLAVKYNERVAEVSKLFRKGCFHYLYIIGSDGDLAGIVPEEDVLRCFLVDKSPESAVGELLR
jgi:stage IV sporulation protein FB